MDFFNIKTIKLSHKIKFITVSSVNAHFCFNSLFKFLTLTPDLSFFSKGEVSSEDVQDRNYNSRRSSCIFQVCESIITSLDSVCIGEVSKTSYTNTLSQFVSKLSSDCLKYYLWASDNI